MHKLSGVFLRSSVVLATLATGFAANTAAAEAEWPVRESLRYQFYGQINQAYLNYDDSLTSRGFLTVDNYNDDGSFVGFLGGTALDNGWVFGGRFELQIPLRSSDEVSLQNPAGPDLELDANDIRHAEVAFASPSYGTVYFGQGDMSANLNAPDYSGTRVIAQPNTSKIAGGMILLLPDASVSGRSLSDAIGTFDSGRRFRLRYDSPEFGGFSMSTSVGREVLESGDDNTYFDLTGAYKHTNATWDYSVVFDITGIGDDEYAAMASFGYLHKPTGLNLTFTGSHSTIERHYFYFKAGIIRDLFSFGSTAVAVDWYNNGNWAAEGSETETFGLSVVQNVDAANMEVYAAVRSFDAYNNLDLPGENFLKGQAFFTGLRWQF